MVNVNLAGRSRQLGANVLNEPPIPMLKQMSGYQYSRFMPTLDRKDGTGTAVVDAESNAEAGLKAILDGRPAEALSVVGSLIYEIVAEG